MSIVVSRLEDDRLKEFRAFCAAAWGSEHPLIHNAEMFEYYYRNSDGKLNFVCARDEDSGEMLSVCGFIPSNASTRPDVWISFLVSKKGAPFGLAYDMFDYIKQLTGCRTFGCNNIRKKTFGLYEFRGWSTGALSQYYRLNDEKKSFELCIPPKDYIQPPIPKAGDIELCGELKTREEVAAYEIAFSRCIPYKDSAYLEKRYIRNPWFVYKIVGFERGGQPLALGVYRVVQTGCAPVLRVVDYLGDCSALPAFVGMLDRELRSCRGEFIDLYCSGIEDRVLTNAGLVRRIDGDGSVIPNYLTPPLMQNTEFYYFTDTPGGYAVFKADGDQDRPNLS